MNANLRFWFPLSIVLALLTSCGSDPALEKRLAALEVRTGSIEGTTAELEKLHDILIERLNRRHEAVLDPTEPGFSTVDTGSGILLVSCSGAEPYLDGHKIKLRIGNPNNMGFSGCEMTVKWGPRAPASPDERPGSDSSWEQWKAWSAQYESWKKLKFRSKTVSLTKDFEPGVWNPVDVVLSPSKADELGELRVAITANAVLLK